MASRRRIERASVQSGVQGAVQGGGREWPMHGRDGGPVRAADADRPIPFFLTDEPIPYRLALVPSDTRDDDALGAVP